MEAKVLCPECEKSLHFVSIERNEMVKCIHCDHEFSVGDSPRESTKRKHPPKNETNPMIPGVRGWLLVFCCYNGLIIPAVLFFVGYLVVRATPEYYVAFQFKITIALTLLSCAMWAVHALFVVAKLVFKRTNAVLHARIYTVAWLIYNGAIVGCLYSLGNTSLDEHALQGIVKGLINSLIQSFIWFQYFRNSERVKATYRS